MTGPAHYALELVPEVEEEPVTSPALTSGTLEHCVRHLETCGNVFAIVRYPMHWFDNHTFTVDLPDGRALFRIVARLEAEAPSSRRELVGKSVSVDSAF
ncbi:hypothetical protein [Nocardia brasiliensis]|uniref:hypothetical protein n=1 Tax=Nocardia brasiliensis TaxID=37326 RepID=UPI003D8F3203